MSWKLSYFDEVSQDIRDAKEWYRNQQKDLEKRFSGDIKTAINRVRKNPLNYELKYKNIRVAYPDVFPYAIHFYIDESYRHIVIVAIVHQSRNPQYSRKRV